MIMVGCDRPFSLQFFLFPHFHRLHSIAAAYMLAAQPNGTEWSLGSSRASVDRLLVAWPWVFGRVSISAPKLLKIRF